MSDEVPSNTPDDVPPWARPFHVADISPRGDLLRIADYRYQQLEQIPGASDLIVHFSASLWRNPEEFEGPLPGSRERLNFRWRACAPSAGIASLRLLSGPASISLLACGSDPEADHITLAAFQAHLVRELRDTRWEPGFDLMHLTQRPLVAIVGLEEPGTDEERLLTALCDRCFAAAYFRHQQLA